MIAPGDALQRWSESAPPWSAEAEMSVLGGMLIDGEAARKAKDMVRDAYFYREGNRRLFRGMVALVERGEVIDAITLSNQLKAAGDLEAVGGMPYVAQLLDAVPTAANIEYHIGIIREKADLRTIHAVAPEIVSLVREGGDKKAAEIYAEVERLVKDAAPTAAGEAMACVKDLVWPVMETWEAFGTERGERRIQSGIHEVDTLVGGFRRGDFVVWAGRPSMGKSAILYNIETDAALRQKLVVAHFSAETKNPDIVSRMIASEARVNVQGARKRGAFLDHEYPRIAASAAYVHAAQIHLDDRSRTMDQVRSKLRRIVRDHGRVDLIGFDYLQKFRAPEFAKFREREIAFLSSEIKEVAMEFDAVAMAAAQLSRAVEQRPDKRPMMSDLRESGAIENDADVIGLLYRPEYYHGDRMEVKAGSGKDRRTTYIDVRGKAEVIFGKVRDGETGTAHIVYHREFTLFEDPQGSREG